MATSTGYDYAVRQGLNQKGITNDRITYDSNKGVMVDGMSFYKPEKVYQGTAFTNQQNFNQAWDNYNKNMQQAANNTANTTQQQPYSYNPYANNSMIQNNPYSSQADQIIQQLLDYGKNQQAFDPYSTSAYQAAQAQAQRAAQQNTRAAQEAYGSAGFGRSTALGERVAGINNDATEYLMTQVLPQIEAQEAARRQQEYNNQVTALQQLLGQQSRADNLVQQDFDNRVTKGQLTGDFMDPEATAIIDQILALKQQAETPGLANTDVKALSAQADQYRNRLSALGYDPALFGSNVNAQTAGGNRGAATRTLAGQEFDLNRQIDQRNFDRDVFESDRDFNEDTRRYNQGFEYTQGRDKVKDEQWQKEFDRILKQDGVQEALAWAANSVARMNAATSAGNLALNRDEFNYRKEQDSKNEKGGGLSQEDRAAEASAMLSALRGGELSPTAALSQIADDERVGVYSKDDADYLRSLIESSARTSPAKETASPEAIKVNQQSLPSDKQIEAEARRLGYPTLDYRSWYKASDGKAAGVDFETWKRLYGPTLSAR